MIFSPAAKNLFARNPNLSVNSILASGRSPSHHHVITKADVMAALLSPVSPAKDVKQVIAPQHIESAPISPIAAATAAAPTAPAPVVGPRSQAHRSHVDVPTTQMRKIIAKRLLESKLTLPHEYMKVEVEMDALLRTRAVFNEHSPTKASVNDFIIKAAAAALRSVPAANAYWTADAVKFHATVDVAFAAATPAGLVTPVIRNADKKPIPLIAKETKDLATRARANKLLPEEYSGGSISVSNLGMYDISEFIAVLNPPQAAILAIGSTQPKTVADAKGGLLQRNVMQIALSHDARVMDGELAAQFCATLKRLLETPSLIFM
uniref:2-oxoacid dehydrogenase acyltransferase catalytic domain-containing protein n=1 Tax=Cryptomonas curvata TaxID=233186 RepID=A0A7S0M526_9CRYP